ncbi:Uncharacterized protein HZ326_31610, partial [Fusarium oxysporum f. sp. albedinis]
MSTRINGEPLELLPPRAPSYSCRECRLGSQGCRGRSYGKSRGAEPGLSKAREAGM